MELASLASTKEDLDEVATETLALGKIVAELEASTMFAGERDDRPAVCYLRAGQGGTEACDWVAMMLRMYERWAPAHGFQLNVASATKGSEFGYSEVMFILRGHRAYGWMRSEHGVHRLARVSPHSKAGRVHTSFAAVEVVPLVAASETMAPLARGELRFDTYRGSGPGGQHRNTRDTAVRATHFPTGLVASCESERSQHRNKERAVRLLTSRVRALEGDRERQASEARREGQAAASFGSQARSYTLHPHKMVIDHRTGFKSADATTILNGELRPLMESWLLSPHSRSHITP